jgi:SARP family transcriptional regulator, regulator of embCAB operon
VQPVTSLRRGRDTDSALTARTSMNLSLLVRFQLVADDCPVHLGPTSQRLLALVALHPKGISRDFLAGLLWPIVSDSCAHTCLRSALVRIAHAAPFALQTSAANASLADDVSVDLRDGQHLAIHLLQRDEEIELDAVMSHIATLPAELLPGWYDEWVVAEAETWRQLRLHALESLADALRERQRFGEASVAAAAAIAVDPLRETARAAMIRVHLAEGNRSEARREFKQYALRVHRDLAGEPSDHLRSLVRDIEL